MFDNCEETIMRFAKIFMVVCIIAAVLIAVIDLADMIEYLLGSTAATVIVCVALVVVGVIGSALIYGIGEGLYCVKSINSKLEMKK